MHNFKEIIASFKVAKVDYEIVPFGSGHINDTLLLTAPAMHDACYLLQKLNHFVFRDIPGLINNIVLVTDHLKRKSSYPEKEVLTLIECHDHKYYYQDAQENYWRMTLFLHHTKSYDIVTNKQQAYQGGLGFGRFQYWLSDLDPQKLTDTIPDFLNIETRLENFNNAVRLDRKGRLKDLYGVVGFLLSRAEGMRELVQLGRAGILPIRITHNDTKFNNILLNSNDEIQCVIDLDTVMSGYIAYDFGDAIRTIINKAAEDERDIYNTVELASI